MQPADGISRKYAFKVSGIEKHLGVLWGWLALVALVCIVTRLYRVQNDVTVIIMLPLCPAVCAYISIRIICFVFKDDY